MHHSVIMFEVIIGLSLDSGMGVIQELVQLYTVGCIVPTHKKQER